MVEKSETASTAASAEFDESIKDDGMLTPEENKFLVDKFTKAEGDETEKENFLDILDTKYQIEDKIKAFSDTTDGQWADKNTPDETPENILMMKCYYNIKNPDNQIWLSNTNRTNSRTNTNDFMIGRFLLYGINDLDAGAKATKLYKFFTSEHVNKGKAKIPVTIAEDTISKNIDLYLALAKWIDRTYIVYDGKTVMGKDTGVDCLNFVQLLYQEKELWGKKLNLRDWTHAIKAFPGLSTNANKVDVSKIPIWSVIGFRTGGTIYDDNNNLAWVWHYWVYIWGNNFAHAFNGGTWVCIDSFDSYSGNYLTPAAQAAHGSQLKFSDKGPFAFYYGVATKTDPITK